MSNLKSTEARAQVTVTAGQGTGRERSTNQGSPWYWLYRRKMEQAERSPINKEQSRWRSQDGVERQVLAARTGAANGT